MKIKFALLALVAGGLLFFSTYSSYTDENRENILANTLVQTLSTRHYAPVKLDDSSSSKIFKRFIEKLDFSKRFLTLEDISKLESFQFKLDDELRDKKFEFFNMALDIINKSIAEVKKFYPDLISKKFDYSIDEYIQIDAEKTGFAKNSAELKDLWRKMLKYESLTRLAEQLEIQEKAKETADTSVKILSYDSLETDSREKVKKRYDDYFGRLEKLRREDRLNDYFNSFAEIFDPHTEYFPPKEKEDFDINMSGSLEGIGAQLSQRDEYIKVERIIPGSPSWKQGQLKEGDVILKVAQGNSEPVDVVDMRLDDAVRLIRGKKGTEVKLTTKKVDGSIVIISIIRDVIQLEETFAKSAIIEDEGTTGKLGYIKLPSFYADFNDRNGRRSSDDMKQELIKLKSDNVNGVILDLRNNGGGSLDDVVEIGGLFIKNGPIVQVDSKFGNTQIREDYDNSIYWNGPLIILVNQVSASASEILAAAMQDYGRAIIIGSEHTFGKGTVQTMLDLDNATSPAYNSYKPFGALKLTIQKFYRINGGSTQLRGVIPDIILPDNYSYSDVGEKSYDYALQWSSINPVKYAKSNYASDYFQSVVNESKRRIASDPLFTKIDDSAKKIKEYRELTNIPLNMDKFNLDRKKRNEITKSHSDITKDDNKLKFDNLTYDKDTIAGDTSQSARMNDWFASLKKDFHLKEAVNVMNDMIRIEKTR